VIARAHAKRRLHDPSVAPLTRFDYLTAVDDESRTGALRLRDADGRFLNSGDTRRTPPLVELGKVYRAAHALEAGTETDADLLYLQGKATSLGGLRPKSTVLEEDGSLALGKFPSLGDGRSVVRGEVLALTLMERAALHPAACRLVVLDGTPMAVIRRFDRQPNGERLHYLSMGSVLQARRDEDHAYTEIADALRQISATPTDDVRLLWKRLVFNLLVNNVDDHLWNMGVLYAGDGKWRLAPAFDVNPFPDRARESKTWLSEDSGPITHLEQLLGACGYFGYARAAAEDAVAQIGSVLAGWRDVATSTRVGLSEGEAEDFAPAFEHGDALLARSLTLA
jgi:serine/threonine-protein kinase HipA